MPHPKITPCCTSNDDAIHNLPKCVQLAMPWSMWVTKPLQQENNLLKWWFFKVIIELFFLGFLKMSKCDGWPIPGLLVYLLLTVRFNILDIIAVVLSNLPTTDRLLSNCSRKFKVNFFPKGTMLHLGFEPQTPGLRVGDSTTRTQCLISRKMLSQAPE